MMSSWLNFTAYINRNWSRIHQSRNAGKNHPFLQCRPYGTFASLDNNPLRLVQGPRSRGIISTGLAERSSDMGLRGRRCIPLADAFAFCLVISSDGNRFDWLSFRDSSADLSTGRFQEMSQVACDTIDLCNPRLRMSNSVLVKSHPVSRGVYK